MQPKISQSEMVLLVLFLQFSRLTCSLSHRQCRKEASHINGNANEQSAKVGISQHDFGRGIISRTKVNNTNPIGCQKEHRNGNHSQENVSRHGNEEKQLAIVEKS